MASKRVTKCAVSSIPAADPGVLRALAGAGVAVVDLRDAPDTVQELRECQFFAAFVDDSLGATSAIEIGIAIGLRKPVLVVASSVEAVPLLLQRNPIIVRSGLSDSDLDLQIRGFAQQFRPRAPQRPETAPISIRENVFSPQSPKASLDSDRSFELSRGQFRSEGEYVVADLFARAGGKVVAQELGERSMAVPDMAVTFGDFGPGLSPLLVEVAGRHADIKRKRSQLAEAVRGRGLLLGLLITLDEQSHDQLPDESVLALSFAQLEALVAGGGFRRAIQRARNYVVHQVS